MVNGNVNWICETVGENGKKTTLGVELLHSSHLAVSNVNIAALIHGQPHGCNKIAGTSSFAAPRAQKLPLAIKNLNSIHMS